MNFIKKHRFFIIYFVVGCLLTLPFILKPHYDFDTYQLFDIGYARYASIFMLSGRVITASFYMLFSYFNVPYDILAVVSVIGGNFFLALSCAKFEKILLEIKLIDKKHALYYVLAIILLFYNFFMMEYFTFMESFIMCMAVYLFMLSIHSFLMDTLTGYKKALLYAILAMLCYQGAISIYIPILAFFVYLKNHDKEFKVLIKEFIIKGFYAVMIYGICYITAFVIMKGYMFISGQVSAKDGSIDIFANLSEFRPMMSAAWKQLFGYFKPVYFYITLLLMIGANAWKAFVHKRIIGFGFLIFIILICFLIPFVPNIFLPSNANYVSPRVMVAVPMAIGLSALFYLCEYPKKSTNLRAFMLVLLLIFNCLNALNFHTMMNNGNDKYYLDKAIVDEIYVRINSYEQTSGNTITKIAYAQEKPFKYFYDFNTRNSFTYRLYAFPWAFEAAINGFSNSRKYQFEELSDIEKSEIFGDNNNYSIINDEQFVFVNDTLYLLLF